MLFNLDKELGHKKISSSHIAYEIFVKLFQTLDEVDQNKEHFIVIGLRRNNTVVFADWVSMGDLTHTIVSPREVFRRAIAHSSHSLVIAHNHVSEELKPSDADRSITRKLVEAGKIINIRILDHLIFHPAIGHFSFADEGLL